ncbi:hypothetical protein [Streptomyces hundungensis]|uniref:hypothetical protein n=1 Tax=Streptomyces hundungensis TaxID=1077946 RepID=UPI0013C50A3D|nr:hypothetical protein [Streptomyces hundungensis]
MLTGVWLRAAARAEQGLELTEFEDGLLAPFLDVLGEQDIFALGRVYREQVATAGSAATVPRSVSEWSLKDGYTVEEYARSAAEVGERAMAQPNVAVIDRAGLRHEQERRDSDEFLAAVGPRTAPPPPRPSPASSTSPTAATRTPVSISATTPTTPPSSPAAPGAPPPAPR